MNRVLRRVVTLVVFLALFAGTLPSSAAAADSWQYTALGDSLGTGFGAWVGYVPRYRNYVAADTAASVSLTNLSQNGWTSADLRDALSNNSTFRTSVQGAQVITWDIGGNDLRNARDSYKNRSCGGVDNQDCLRATVATFKQNWSAIIVEIEELQTLSSGPAMIRTMDIYKPYVKRDKRTDTWKRDGKRNDFEVFKTYIDDVNAYIAATAAEHEIPYARVYEAFNGPNGDQDPADKGYMFIDGLHPNDTGHKVIADLFRGLGYAPLR